MSDSGHAVRHQDKVEKRFGAFNLNGPFGVLLAVFLGALAYFVFYPLLRGSDSTWPDASALVSGWQEGFWRSKVYHQIIKDTLLGTWPMVIFNYALSKTGRKITFTGYLPTGLFLSFLSAVALVVFAKLTEAPPAG